MTEKEATLSGWAIVAQMGHRTYAGQISEHVIGSAALLRIDVPAHKDQPAFTKLLGPSSIFDITPCTEEVARAALDQYRPRPLYELGLPALPAPVNSHGHGYTIDEDLDDDFGG